MGFFKNASELQSGLNRSGVLIAIVLVLVLGGAYQFHWADKPYRDGAERHVRGDAVVAQAAGDIRRVNLKTIVRGSCQSRCSTYIFSVLGTRALLRVGVESWNGPQGKPVYRIVSVARW